MKDCKYFKNNMSLYIDNMLSDAQKNEFDAHFKICSSCKKEIEELKSIASVLSNIKTQAPDNLTQNVMSKIENIHTKKQNVLLPFSRYATALIAVFLLVAILKTPVMEYFEKDYIENTPEPITTQQDYQHPVKAIENNDEQKKEEITKIKDNTTDINIKNQPVANIEKSENATVKSVKRNIIKDKETNNKEQKPLQEEAKKEEAPSVARMMPAIAEEKAIPQTEETIQPENYSIAMAAFDAENREINITTNLSLDDAITLINSSLNKDFSASEDKIEITLSYDEYTYLHDILKDNTSFFGFENINFGEDVNIVILSK